MRTTSEKDHGLNDTGQLVLRAGRDTDVDAARFQELSNSLYSRKITNGYYGWQFFNPAAPAVICVAESTSGKFVGCYGMQLRRVRGSSLTLSMALDIMVAPCHQGTGLFRRLAVQAADMTANWSTAGEFVLANTRAHLAHVHGLGWRDLGFFRDMARVEVCPIEIARTWTSQPVAAFNAADCNWLSSTQARGRKSVSFERMPEWLTWRTLLNPRYRYEVLRWSEGVSVVGFTISKQFQDPVSCERSYDVLDVICQEKHRECLLGQLVARADQNAVGPITTWLPGGRGCDGGSSILGFETTERKRYLSCRVALDEDRWLENSTVWELSMLDADLY